MGYLRKEECYDFWCIDWDYPGDMGSLLHVNSSANLWPKVSTDSVLLGQESLESQIFCFFEFAAVFSSLILIRHFLSHVCEM